MTSAKISRLLSRDDMMSDTLAQSATALFTSIEDVRAGKRIVCKGDITRTCHLLVGGVAFRHLDKGAARQITTFLVPGDWSDVHGLFYPKVSYSITTLTACQLAVIDHAVLSQLMDEQPLVARGLWLATLREAAIEREWLLNIGQRTDEERIAHLLSELVLRFQKSDLCHGQSCELPLANLELVQCTACSSGTVERVLKAFEEMGILVADDNRVIITNFARLRALGAFEPSYLELPADAHH